MARPLRLSFENAFYHIISRGNRKEAIYYTNDDRIAFIEKLKETCTKYSFICYAYCLMNNHYHLFIKTPMPNLSDGIHYLNSSYANWFKAKYKIVGALFQGRFKSIIVDGDNYAIKLSTYIHLNPVRAGIVKNPKEYKWSSYIDYIGKRHSSFLETKLILKQFNHDLNKASKEYEKYVLNNIDMVNPLKDSYKGIAIGSDRFIERIKEMIQSVGSKREIVETKKITSCTPEEIIQKLVSEMSITREDIFKKKKGNLYRQKALYLLKKYSTLTLKEIGEMFQMDYSAVSQACKRYEEKMERKISDLSNVET